MYSTDYTLSETVTHDFKFGVGDTLINVVLSGSDGHHVREVRDTHLTDSDDARYILLDPETGVTYWFRSDYVEKSYVRTVDGSGTTAEVRKTTGVTIEHKFNVGDIVKPAEPIQGGWVEFRIDDVRLNRNRVPVYRMTTLTGYTPMGDGEFVIIVIDDLYELVEPESGLKFKFGDTLGLKSDDPLGLKRPKHGQEVEPICEVIGVDRDNERYHLRYHLDGSEGIISAEHIERKYAKLTQTWEVAES